MAAKTELVLIPREHVDTVWPLAEAHLRRAMRFADNEFTLDDARGFLREGRFQLWLAWEKDGKRVIGAGVTEVFAYPRKRVCFLVLWASDAPRHSWLSCLGTVERWAKAQGCAAMRLMGRRGWGKVLDRYRPHYTVFTRSLDVA